MISRTYPDDFLIVQDFTDTVDQECYDHATQDQAKYRYNDYHMLRLSFTIRL